MKQPATAGTRSPGLRELIRPGTPSDLRVRYYTRMKPQRVYPLVVEVLRSAPPSAGVLDPLVVQPVIAGAQVVPAYQNLQPQPGQRVTFHVTPLARGRFPVARVTVSQAGAAPQQIPLRIKVVTQRLTWVLLALTLLIPLGLLTFTRWSPLGGMIPEKIPHPATEEAEAPKEPKAKAKAKKGDGEQAAEDKPVHRDTMLIQDSPGHVLEYRLNEFWKLARRDVPESSYWSQERVEAATANLGYGYDMVSQLGDQYLSMWVGLILLLLTFWSWQAHRSRRTSRRQKVELNPRPVTARAEETLPLATPEAQPLTVEPA